MNALPILWKNSFVLFFVLSCGLFEIDYCQQNIIKTSATLEFVNISNVKKNYFSIPVTSISMFDNTVISNEIRCTSRACPPESFIDMLALPSREIKVAVDGVYCTHSDSAELPVKNVYDRVRFYVVPMTGQSPIISSSLQGPLTIDPNLIDPTIVVSYSLDGLPAITEDQEVCLDINNSDCLDLRKINWSAVIK